jgi:hypothetical protein
MHMRSASHPHSHERRFSQRRHSRESGNPSWLLPKSNLDSSLLKAEHIRVLSPRTRFRGNDGSVAACNAASTQRSLCTIRIEA